MLRFGFLLVLLALPSFGAVAIVQQKLFSRTTANTSVSVTFTSNVTAGNTIVAAVAGSQNAAIVAFGTCTDTQSNTYALDVSRIHATSTVTGSAIWSAVNVTGGAVTVTCSYTGSSYTTLYVYELSGGATSSILDTTSSAETFTGSLYDCGTLTTTQADDFIIAVIASSYAGSNLGVTASGAGFTIDATNGLNNNGGAAGTAGATESGQAATATNYSPKFNFANANPFGVCVAAAYKSSTGAPLVRKRVIVTGSN